MLTWKIEDEDFVEENVEMEDVEFVEEEEWLLLGSTTVTATSSSKTRKG